MKLRSQPWKIDLVFRPMLNIIDQLIQEKTVDRVPDGTAVFRDTKDGGLYETRSAISGVIDAYEIHERRHGRDLNMGPLRQLINRMHYDMPLVMSDIRTARAALERMRMETMQMTADYADQMLRDFKIKEGIERLAA